jgi:hypothetical protein
MTENLIGLNIKIKYLSVPQILPYMHTSYLVENISALL